MQHNTINTDKFEKLTESLIGFNEVVEESRDIEKTCKIGFKKLVLARSFAEIDNKILSSSMGKNGTDANFLTDLIYLETKRLRFKEQTNKCTSKKTKVKIST